jgi:predicted O-linked N-acetylglucosamine transferase (SPINDLY family)
MSLLARLRKRHSALRATLQAPTAQPGPAIDRPPNGQADSVAAMAAVANQHFQAGDLNTARELYKRMLELDSRCARAYYMLSGIAAQEGDLSSAIGLAQRAIGLQPVVPEFHFSLAGVFFSQGDKHKALSSYQEALRLKPDSLDYQRAVAGAFLAVGALDAGVDAYRAIATAGAPNGHAYFELGKALQLRGDLKAAEEAFAKAVSLSPESEGAHLHLALVRREQGRPVDAERPARQAVALAPTAQEGWFVLGGVLGDQGRHAEAVQHFRKVLAIQADDDAAWSGVLFSMHYSEEFNPREIFEEHLKFGERFPKVPAMTINAARLRPGRRIRVGYLSPDLWLHPVAHFMAPILSHHDHGRFEVFCYHTGKSEDAMTVRLKSGADHWRHLAGVSDPDLERALRADELDILVELTGHSDHQRLAVLATRVAPAQVTYLGYPNTTGLAAIDYRITDARADPPGEPDKLHVEKLVRLPETFLCYATPAVEPQTPAAPFHSNGHVTFGSFNNFAKLSPITIKLWSRILAVVPNSRLLVKTRGLQDPGLRRLFLTRFEQHGINADRITLMPPIPDRRQHLQTYGQVDIALDPFPYHGTTTTMEALWMGVPVVTLAGDRHASRVGVSILSALGLVDLVATTEDEYVQISARLAGADSELDGLRRSLRSRLTNSPLTDGARFTAHLEHAYLEMWEEIVSRSGAHAPPRLMDR